MDRFTGYRKFIDDQNFLASIFIDSDINKYMVRRSV
jgi:hypothetical protein